MKILVIEDEPKIARSIKKGLEQEAFAVDVEHGSDEGLATALNIDYDVLIIDRMLPGSFDGVELIKQLRTANKQAPILMLTARTSTADKVSGLNAGADDYLPKPFDFSELVARVRALLRRPPETSDNVLNYKSLRLDIDSFSLKRDQTAIPLLKKEFAVLEYMLRNPEKVLSKDSILNHVWNFDSDILPSSIEVYIANLRKKIDKPFAPPSYIQTVRGIGYKLEENNHV